MYINRYILQKRKKIHPYTQRHPDVNVYSKIITHAHMLASTNIQINKPTCIHLSTNIHTDWPVASALTVQYLPMNRASKRGLFYEHKYHYK